MAWGLATNPNPKARRPEFAYWNARAVLLASEPSSEALDAAAAAAAAMGRFNEAVQFAEQATAKNLPPELSKAIRGRLDLYKQNRPYIQEAFARK
jgi:hypothetical protein